MKDLRGFSIARESAFFKVEQVRRSIAPRNTFDSLLFVSEAVRQRLCFQFRKLICNVIVPGSCWAKAA